MKHAGYLMHGTGALREPERFSVMAGCGHTVYEGEQEYHSRVDDLEPTRCPDCMEAAFEELSISTKARLLEFYGIAVRDYSR